MNRLILLLSLVLFSSAPARAERRPFSLDRMDRPAIAGLGGNSENVSYYGGPVISHAKVHLIFWGEGVAAETQAQLEEFYRGLVDSTYLDELAEYATNVRAVDGREGTGQKIGRGSFGRALTIVPVNKSASLTQADLERELESQIQSGALPKPDADSLYMIHFPDGYRISISFGESCSTWFADHEVYRSPTAGNVYYAIFPCSSGDSSRFSTLTFAASHELAEAVTDPMSPLGDQTSAFPQGWIRGADEIGDLCTSYRGTFNDGGRSYTVNPLWLNSHSGCGPESFSRRPSAAESLRSADLPQLQALTELALRGQGLPR